MEYKTKKNDNASVEIHIKNDPDEVEAAYQKAYEKAKQTLKLPGFRKGKVPKEIAEKHLGESVAGDAVRQLISDTFQSIAEDLDPVPLSMPTFEVESFDREKGAVYTGEYETHPEVKLGKYKKIKVIQDYTSIANSFVEEQLDRLRKEHASLITREEDEPAADGDKVVLNMTAREGEEVLFEDKELNIELGAEENVIGMNENVPGLKLGEEKSFDSAFPEDFPDPAFSGKTLNFTVKPTAIQKQEMPDLNDEFAKEVGEYETLTELRDAIQKELETHSQDVLDKRAREALLGIIVKDCKYAIPNVLVEREVKQRLEALQTRFNLPNQDMAGLASIMGRDVKELEQEFKDSALRTIKADLALMEIAKKEELQVDQDEIEAEVRKKFGSMLNDQQIEEWLGQESFVSNVRSSILYSKTLDWLFDKAEVKKGKEIPYEDLRQARDFG